jgi:hypothetical protein
MNEEKIVKQTKSVIAGCLILSFIITLIIAGTFQKFFDKDVYAFVKNVILVNITFIGDAIFSFGLVFFLFFLFNKKSVAIKLLFSVLLTIFIVQVIKNIVGDGMPVHLYFEKNSYLFESADSRSNIISSHTAMAFTLLLFFLPLCKRKIQKVILIVTAITIMFSGLTLSNETFFAQIPGVIAALSVAAITKLIYRSPKKNLIRRNYRTAGRDELLWN